MDYQGYLWVHGQEPHSDQNKNVSVHEVPEDSLVPLFVLADNDTEDLEDMEDILVVCDTTVIDKKHTDVIYSGWGGEANPALMKPLLTQSNLTRFKGGLI